LFSLSPELNPRQRVQALLDCGWNCLSYGDLSTSKTLANKALKLCGPDIADRRAGCYSLLSHSSDKAGQSAQATKYLLLAVQQPHGEIFCDELAQRYIKAGNLRAAENVYLHYSGSLWNNLALSRIYVKMGDLA